MQFKYEISNHVLNWIIDIVCQKLKNIEVNEMSVIHLLLLNIENRNRKTLQKCYFIK